MNVIKKWLQTQPLAAAAIKPPGGSSQPGLHPLKQPLGSSGPNRPTGHKRRFLQHRLWRQSAMAGLLCTVVVLTYALFGMIAFHFYYHFWFMVFLILFAPIWLVCYGLLFATRWKWHEMALGVFGALFLIVQVYLKGVDDSWERLLSTLSLAGGGVLAVSLGFWIAKLGQSFTQTEKRPGS
ncbi:hypothetical protein CIG75_18130 [Tumebacillus algifaecis]|uniref:Uncharacterized protein n=1 Tax=Tumebacillus algifaecis TaxID=1214604 RepID=A0A223D507_9BACL|nr:hypothetical protein [Tumebacillus algifaecis]ASS76699.1 hypothetical protein CIG75_18130 [Tumebacillus algifaecis]